jgi:Tfp pilus assembly protein PilZ
LPADFTAGGETYRSYSSDISKKGLFIRTNRAFEPGSDIEILLHLPDDSIAFLKGRVGRAIKTPLYVVKNGMGIELTEVDENFRRFIKEEFNEEFDYTSRNILPPSRSRQTATASSPRASGNTGSAISSAVPPAGNPDEAVIIQCSNCNAKNKIRRSKFHLGPRCGKCKVPLPV